MRDYNDQDWLTVDPETEATIGGLITGVILGTAFWGLVWLAVIS